MSTFFRYFLYVWFSVLAETKGLPEADNASLLWGPYRPNLYVGIRPRIPDSLVAGLMWSNADSHAGLLRNLRHTCEQDEGMAGYGWTNYDIRTGGTHVVNDNGNHVDLVTQFSKSTAGGWALRVTSLPRTDATSHERTTIFSYIGMETVGETLECANNLSDGIIRSDNSTAHKTSVRSLTVAPENIWQAKSILSGEIKSITAQEGVLENQAGQGNLHLVQKQFEGTFEFDVLFSSDSSPQSLTSDVLTRESSQAHAEFQDRFRLVYAPSRPFQTEEYAKFSQHLLSNLVGGIGYFHGKSRVDASSAEEYSEVDLNFWEKAASARAQAVVEEHGPYHLFSTVPSRPFFPRGFLSDKGFHLQVVLNWDMDLALEIVSSWFDLMNEDGWIAREQILGPEARSKVPPDFQVQYPHYANPPTLFLVVQAFLTRLNSPSSYSGAPSHYLADPAAGRAFLHMIYPKVKRHFQWFCQTQVGNLTHYQLLGTTINQGYRWRGRTPQHTLTSGLDDYPRPQPPHPEELNVDALSWVGSMAVTLREISEFHGDFEDAKIFSDQGMQILRSLDEVHWSEPDQAYCDTTMVNHTTPKKVCHKGYVSLLPFCLGLMDPINPHLKAVLELINDPVELWSPFGVRSLSAKDKYYGTEEDYWRGPVWMNINYMILVRLLTKELAQGGSIHQSRASNMYRELRLNLVNTVFTSWKDTGFAWEQYNANSGKGQRTQHFTGWTALIVKVLAMPDLPEPSPAHGAGATSGAVGLRDSDMQLYIFAMAIALFVYFFRRRLSKLWKRLSGLAS
ncbi:MAG: hypothetical protein Q9221_005631 [Calogaya cf. arnoldii]